MNDYDYETKLEITKWVMENIVKHAEEGGSYRYLIYERLGFGPDAYGYLLDSGMTISNEFDLSSKELMAEVVRENNYDKMKPFLGMCDEPDCWNSASAGWPSENGYRHTCHEHWKKDD